MPTLATQLKTRLGVLLFIVIMIVVCALSIKILKPIYAPTASSSTSSVVQPHPWDVHGATRPLTSCTTPAPTSAAAYSHMFDTLPADQWQGADGSMSVRLIDGRVVWIYADTISTVAPTFVHSTSIVQDRGCFHVGHAGTQLLPNDADGTYYWPSAAVTISSTQVLVSVVHVQSPPDGGSFTVLGGRLAVVNVVGDPTFSRWIDLPQSPNAISGAGLYYDGSRLHVYTTTDVKQYLVFGRQLSHRTVTLSRLLTGASDWSSDVTVIPATPNGTDSNVSTYADAHGFHALTKQWNFLGTVVLRYDAPRPAGPFGSAVTVLQSPSNGDHMTYSAEAHPWAALSNGRLLVTVCNNGPNAFVDPVHVYRPTFYEIAH